MEEINCVNFSALLKKTMKWLKTLGSGGGSDLKSPPQILLSNYDSDDYDSDSDSDSDDNVTSIKSSTCCFDIVEDALLYCSIFLPDHEFDRDTLIQLWIAVGYFVEEPMEWFAGSMFDHCLTKGYFEFTRTYYLTGKAMYKFKGGGDRQLDASHVSVRCRELEDATAFIGCFRQPQQLRTLMFLQGRELSAKQIPRQFFLSLTQLRVLDLSNTRLIELPSSVGYMKSLCFLNLSGTPIASLPDDITCLTNLQTLKLVCCSNLCCLPEDMRKLKNLRHLEFSFFRQLYSMPEGMGELTNIRTLSAFLVGVEEGSSIKELKNLNNLSGRICISRLENVSTKDEAEEACLSDKSELNVLELEWNHSLEDEDVKRYGEVLSSLKPSTSLEKLSINCYGGYELPSWICDPAFSKLVSVTLFACENCLVLSSLGQLPSLKYLSIVDFNKLKVIDHSFYGGLSVPGYIAFPKLETLTLERMLSLEEWSGLKSFDFPHLLKLTVTDCPKLHRLCTSFRSLEHMEICYCGALASLPDGMLPARLDTFIVVECPLLSARYLNGVRGWLKISRIPHVWIDDLEISFGRRFYQGLFPGAR